MTAGRQVESFRADRSNLFAIGAAVVKTLPGLRVFRPSTAHAGSPTPIYRASNPYFGDRSRELGYATAAKAVPLSRCPRKLYPSFRVLAAAKRPSGALDKYHPRFGLPITMFCGCQCLARYVNGIRHNRVEQSKIALHASVGGKSPDYRSWLRTGRKDKHTQWAPCVRFQPPHFEMTKSSFFGLLLVL